MSDKKKIEVDLELTTHINGKEVYDGMQHEFHSDWNCIHCGLNFSEIRSKRLTTCKPTRMVKVVEEVKPLAIEPPSPIFGPLHVWDWKWYCTRCGIAAKDAARLGGVCKPLKVVQQIPEGVMTASYDADSLKKICSSWGETDVTIYPPPMFLMSPRTKVYLAKDVKKFKGHLSNFQPSDMPMDIPPEGEGIEVTLEIIMKE